LKAAAQNAQGAGRCSYAQGIEAEIPQDLRSKAEELERIARFLARSAKNALIFRIEVVAATKKICYTALRKILL
jgi:hypothetical protein